MPSGPEEEGVATPSPPYTAPCARAWGGKPRPDSRLEEVLPCISALHSSASTRRAAATTQRNPGRERPGLYTEAASSRPFAQQSFSFPPNLLIPYPPNSLTSSSPIFLTSYPPNFLKKASRPLAGSGRSGRVYITFNHKSLLFSVSKRNVWRSGCTMSVKRVLEFTL